MVDTNDSRRQTEAPMTCA